MSRAITIEVPDQLLELLGSEDEIGKEAKRSLVLSLVGRGRISRGKAAELLGMSLWDMPEFLSGYRITWFDYTREQLEEEIPSGMIDNMTGGGEYDEDHKHKTPG